MISLPSALRLATATLLFASLPAFAAEPTGLEKQLSGVLEAIEANRLGLATQRVEALIAAHPNFRLAHLIRGDLLLARARPLETFGNVPKTVPREKVEDLRAEALLRLKALRDRPNADRVPHRGTAAREHGRPDRDPAPPHPHRLLLTVAPDGVQARVLPPESHVYSPEALC